MFESVVVVPMYIYIYTCILFPWHSLRFYISRCPLSLSSSIVSVFFFFFCTKGASQRRELSSILLERYFPFRREVSCYSHLREIRLLVINVNISRILTQSKTLLFTCTLERIKKSLHISSNFHLDSVI